MSPDRSPLEHLNRVERRLLGFFVTRMFASENPRFTRALEENGPTATARMSCVNALRIYAMAFFVLGIVGELLRSRLVAYPLMALAAICVFWSCWCLYTVIGPEREYKREHGDERRSGFGLRRRRSAGPVG